MLAEYFTTDEFSLGEKNPSILKYILYVSPRGSRKKYLEFGELLPENKHTLQSENSKRILRVKLGGARTINIVYRRQIATNVNNVLYYSLE